MLLNAVTLVSVLGLLVTTKATPVQLAARSFPSAGIECYYECPQSIQGGATLSGSSPDAGTNASRQYSTCSYTYSGVFYCSYYSDDGSLESGNTDLCAAQAPVAGCGADYASGQSNPYNFKRSMVPRAKRETAAQKRIRGLQYDPKRRS
ncbi:hypothetical protein JCM24511_09400 [Saitozyma sp. JCM 24511]|nr:hypothetical protein JCM24511_09400 [Saitozyma sp. JCM 24511]